MVRVLHILRNVKIAKQSGRQIRRSHGTLANGPAILFRCSDHLAMPQATTSQAHRHDVRPVIATVCTVLRPHIRSPPEFPHCNHQHLVKQSSFLQIRHQSRQQVVKQRQQWPQSLADPAVGWNVVAVSIPCSRGSVIAEIQCDKRRTSFNQSASNQRLLAPEMISIASAYGWVLTVQIEGGTSPVTKQQVHSLPLIGTKGIHGSILISSGFQHVKLL